MAAIASLPQMPSGRSRDERRKRRQQHAVLFVECVHPIIEIVHFVLLGETLALCPREPRPIVLSEQSTSLIAASACLSARVQRAERATLRRLTRLDRQSTRLPVDLQRCPPGSAFGWVGLHARAHSPLLVGDGTFLTLSVYDDPHGITSITIVNSKGSNNPKGITC